MANFVLNAQAREVAQQGKGSSRRLRHAAQIPAIIYGGSAEPVAVTLELREIVKAFENVKIQALQRHPAKNTPMHADFKRA